MRIANDFLSWRRDPKIVIHGNSCIILHVMFSVSIFLDLVLYQSLKPFSTNFISEHNKWCDCFNNTLNVTCFGFYDIW